MSTIKPLNPMASSVGVSPTTPELNGPTAGGAVAKNAPTDATRQVIADLAAGGIASADAAGRLAAAIASQSGVPEAARAVVEQRLRALLATDPTLATLLAKVASG